MRYVAGLGVPRGFTLVELAVVLVIGGVIVAAATSMFRGQVEYSRAKLTEERIKVIREAIAGYALLNDSKLPCVASLTTPPSDANFGKAQSICDEDGDDVNADGDTVLGVFVGDGRDPDGTDPLTGYVRIGAVPVRTLGLSNEFITDGWDRRFVYAVTENQVNGGYDGKHGSIKILDAAGHSATDPASNVVYAVVSMGPDGKGSYSLEGVRNGPDCGAAPGVDNENCDMADATFASTTLYSKAEDAAFFDDYIAYETILLDLITPAETSTGSGSGSSVIAVHSQSNTVPSCPAGWHTDLSGGYSIVYNGGVLEGAGSCAPEFNPMPVMVCGERSSSRCGQLSQYYATHRSWWLGTREDNWGTQTGDHASDFNVISRCSLCSKNVPVRVVHSRRNTVPDCPTGFDDTLWEGYSFAGYLDEGTHGPGGADSFRTNLNAPESCVREYRRRVLTVCSSGHGDGVCGEPLQLNAGEPLWLNGAGPTFDYDDINVSDVGRCRVCAAPEADGGG